MIEDESVRKDIEELKAIIAKHVEKAKTGQIRLPDALDNAMRESIEKGILAENKID